MRKLVLLATLLLPACATPNRPAAGHVPPGACNAANTAQFIGQPGTSDTGAAILQATHSSQLRWAPPGYALTMDYRFDRVTVRLDANYKVTQVSCG